MPRRLAVALAALLVATASFAVGAPRVAAATPAKVVIVVGPAGSATSSYRTEASALATEARRYTANVITLFSPNATWEVVRPALQGANVVIYLGHGNGFPSPYSTTLLPDRQDGIGLNPYAGSGDVTTKYWGESYLASYVRLAPNAVVLLLHVCYAAGSSEPGMGQPTVDVAVQRSDNMSAGWFASGARAVIADAHSGSVYYLRSLFTTHQTVEALWRASANAKRHDIPYPSGRSAGAVGILDPDLATASFYRSIVVQPGLTTDQVLAGADAVAPGGGTGAEAGASDGTGVIDVTPPVLATVGTSFDRATFSPNGDGTGDRVSMTVATTEGTTIDARVVDATGATIRAWSVPGPIGRTTLVWDGTTQAGRVARDGRYAVIVTARDASGNTSAPRIRSLLLYGALGFVTASVPAIWATDPTGVSPTSAELSFRLLAPATASLAILDATGATVARLLPATALAAGTYRYRWDGRDASGGLVRTSTYRILVTAAGAPGLGNRQGVRLGVGPFRLTPSVSTATRGTPFTLEIASARPLGATPVVTVYQPGLTARTATVTASGSTGDRWTARIGVLLGSSTGTLSIRVVATEDGVTFGTWLRLPLR